MEDRQIVKLFLEIILREIEENVKKDVKLDGFSNEKVILILGNNIRANTWLINNLKNKNASIEIFIYGDNFCSDQEMRCINSAEVPGFDGWSDFCKKNDINSIIFFNSSLNSLDSYYTEEVLANIDADVKQFVFLVDTYELCEIKSESHLKTLVLYTNIIEWFANSNIFRNEIIEKKVNMITQRNRVIGDSEYIQGALETIKRELFEDIKGGK